MQSLPSTVIHMGSGTSTPFKSVPPEASLPQQIGSRGSTPVHLVGTVAPVELKVISAPFSGHQGVAVRVKATKEFTHSGNNALFWAQTALDFYVADGYSKVRVVVSDADCWAWKLRETHEANNIMVDENRQNLLSGGKLHEHRMIEPRTGALEFWERLNGGCDPVERIQRLRDVEGAGHLSAALGGVGPEDLQRPRRAYEQTLLVGDAVAIHGILSMGEDGQPMVTPELPGGKKGMITNDPKVAASLNGRASASAVLPQEQGELRVIQMGKHKKATTHRKAQGW